MTESNDDLFDRLQERLDNWSGEISKTRETLTQQLAGTGVQERPGAPGLSATTRRNLWQPEQSASIADADSEAAEKLRDTLDEKNRLQRKIEDLEARLSEAENHQAHQGAASDRLLSEIKSLIEQRSESDAQLMQARVEADNVRKLQSAQKLQLDIARETIGKLQTQATEIRDRLSTEEVPEPDRTAPVISVSPAPSTEGDGHGQIAVAGAPGDTEEQNRLRSELGYARDILQQTVLKLEQLQARHNETERRADEAAREAGRLALELDTVRQDLTGKDHTLQKAREELNWISGTLPTPGDRADIRQTVLRPLSEELLEKDAELRRLHQELSVLQLSTVDPERVHGLLREAANSMQLELDSMGYAAREFEARLAQARETLAGRDAALHSAKRELAELQQQLEAVSDANGKLRTESDDARLTIQAQEAALSDLQARLESGPVTSDRASDAAAESAAEVEAAALREELEDTRASLANASGRLEDLQLRLEEREILEAALRGEIAELRQRSQTLQDGGGRSNQADQQGFEYEQLIKALREELESLRSMMTQKDFELHHAHEQINDLSRRELEEDDRLKDALETTVMWRKEAKENADVSERVAQELRALRASFSSKEDQLRALTAELDALRGELAARGESEPLGDQDRARYKASIAALRAAMAEKSEELETLRRAGQPAGLNAGTGGFGIVDDAVPDSPDDDGMSEFPFVAPPGSSAPDRPRPARAPFVREEAPVQETSTHRPADPFARTADAYLFTAGRILLLLGVMLTVFVLLVKGQIDPGTVLPLERLDGPLNQLNLRQMLLGLGGTMGMAGGMLLILGLLRGR